jgi:hypothetical protein
MNALKFMMNLRSAGNYYVYEFMNVAFFPAEQLTSKRGEDNPTKTFASLLSFHTVKAE